MVGLSSPKPTAAPEDGQEAKRPRLNEVSEADLNMPLRVLASRPSELSDIPDDLEYVSGEEESEEEEAEHIGSIRNLPDEKSQEKTDRCAKVRDRIVMAYLTEDAEDHREEQEDKDDGSTHATVVADLAETTKPQGEREA